MEKLISSIAYLEIASPDVDASADFYTQQFGMRVTDRTEDAAYLRCWGDYYRYSLIIRKGEQPALTNIGWRTESQEALAAAAKRVNEAGITGEWLEPDLGRGEAFEFVGPYGHRMQLLWEIENYQAPEEFASTYPDRPEKRSSHAGAPRFLDHVTIAASDVDGFAAWYNEVLGFRIMARTQLDDTNGSVFTVLTNNEKSHDLGVVLDHSSTPGRVNHIAFWVDSREELMILSLIHI